MKIRSTGALLTAIAWLGAVLCTLYNVGILNGGWLLSQGLVPATAFGGANARFALPEALAVIARWALQLHVLWWLRCAGLQWHRAPLAAGALAQQFLRLAHALVLLGIYGACVPANVVVRLPREAVFLPQRFGFQTLYMLAVGAICIYAMAHFISEAARLREENEGFV